MLTGITLFRFAAVSLLPMLAAVGFYLAEKKTLFGKLPNFWKQISIGIGFGIVAIFYPDRLQCIR